MNRPAQDVSIVDELLAMWDRGVVDSSAGELFVSREQQLELGLELAGDAEQRARDRRAAARAARANRRGAR